MDRVLINRGRNRRGIQVFSVFVLLLLTACGGNSTPDATALPQLTPGGQASVVSGGKITVVTTTTQIRSMAEAVAGDKATVRSILTPGADPHEFEPRPSDVQAISESALVLKNGAGLDEWVDKLITNAGGQRPLVVVSTGVPLREGAEEGGGKDPHIWFSATNAMTMTRTIRDSLVKVDPANAAAYNDNATAYLTKLDELDKYILGQVSTIPKDNRRLVTNHDAFGYYIDRYGLTFVGSIIPSMSTGAEPSAQDVAAIIKKLKEENVRAIFLESSINPTLAKQIGNDAGVKVVDTLYGDTLGAAGTPGADYIGMMRYNTDTIIAALR